MTQEEQKKYDAAISIIEIGKRAFASLEADEMVKILGDALERLKPEFVIPLRPLSDIKREEIIDVAKILYAGIDEKNDEETFCIIEKAMKGEIKGVTWLRDLKGCFSVTQYLISKNFNLS